MQDRIARIEETSCTARPDHTFFHKPAYLNPRWADGMSAMLAIVSDFAALQRRKCRPTARGVKLPKNTAMASLADGFTELPIVTTPE